MSSASSTPTSTVSGISFDESTASSRTDASVGISAKLLVNARVVGVDGDCDAVLARGGVIEWIGKEAEAPTGEYEIIDVRGQWVAPSMIDWHIHSKLQANNSHRIDLKTCRSAESVLQRLSSLTPSPSDRPEIIGVNMRNGSWTDDHLMSRITLDERVSLTRPVFLFYNGYHSMVCNTAGIIEVGLDPDSHSGILKEHEAWEPMRKVGLIDDETMDRWVFQEAEKAAAMGVTEVVDLEIDFNIRDWSRRGRKGFNTLRVHVGVYDMHFDDAIERGLKTGDTVPDTDGLVKVGPYKIVTDGGLGSQTAYCHEPYPGTTDYGILSYSQEDFARITQRATSHGYKLAIHAIGDKCNSMVLRVLASNPQPPLPGSTIEHAQLLVMDDIKYFQQLNLIASVQPKHLADDRETCLRYWTGREGRAWALRSLRDAGVPMKFGSDAPVADLNPWEAMAVAISRSDEGGIPLSEEQAIDIETAWISSTSNNARALRVGDRADLIVIDRNPLECDASGLRRVQVIKTMLDGRWTYQRKI